MLTLKIHQMPATLDADAIQWNLDEYIVHYNRRTRTLTVEEFFGFDDDGNEDTEVITDEETIRRILNHYKPGWPTPDGFRLFAEHYENWEIGQKPI